MKRNLPPGPPPADREKDAGGSADSRAARSCTKGRPRRGRRSSAGFGVHIVDAAGAGPWESSGDVCSIGSAAGNDLQLADETVSGFHCEIRVAADRVHIVDLGSLNGTVVDGVHIKEAFLRNGSLIRLGAAKLRFELADGGNRLLVSDRTSFGEMHGMSVPARVSFALMEKAAGSDATVLLEGETGTGKGQAAEAIHQRQRAREQAVRRRRLRRHPRQPARERAVRAREGRLHRARRRAGRGAFEEAAGGTIFLDEIGELPLDLQPKLLRALENRHVRALGTSVLPAGRRAHHRRDQPRPARRGEPGALPRRPVLPAVGRADRAAAAAPAPGGHPAARARSCCATWARPRRAWPASARRRSSRACRGRRGRATSASCATTSNAAWCSRSRCRSAKITAAARPSRAPSLAAGAAGAAGAIDPAVAYAEARRSGPGGLRAAVRARAAEGARRPGVGRGGGCWYRPRLSLSADAASRGDGGARARRRRAPARRRRLTQKENTLEEELLQGSSDVALTTGRGSAVVEQMVSPRRFEGKRPGRVALAAFCALLGACGESTLGEPTASPIWRESSQSIDVSCFAYWFGSTRFVARRDQLSAVQLDLLSNLKVIDGATAAWRTASSVPCPSRRPTAARR